MHSTHDLWDVTMCIATWLPTTYQIWEHSAKKFLSYSLATHFDNLYAARVTYHADPPNACNLVVVFLLIGLLFNINRVEIGCTVIEIYVYFISVICSAGR